ncbi:MAG TPA: RNHCP domain-containing protein [Myxococcales bacterium]|nr:RNHCP domain-containing protein [Myxococcales bacterium]HIK86678.1 RNHCP domain-containing protein [Myxococcales bacterium]
MPSLQLTIGAGAFGTEHRNHCPNCLSSKHADEHPGHRAPALPAQSDASFNSA